MAQDSNGSFQRPSPTEVRGIGGWLLLPMAGMVLSLVYFALGLGSLRDLFLILPRVDPGVGTFLVVETVVAGLLQLVAPIYLLVLFFNTRIRFPRHYCYWLASVLIYSVLDLIATWILVQSYFAVAGQDPRVPEEVWQAPLRAALVAAIWIPYMNRSVRVKNTFVN
jgi:hypothetical protein